jgi:hypothetical protein
LNRLPAGGCWNQEAERVTAGQIGNRKSAEPPSLTNGGVMMRSPTGGDTAYGMEGDKYTPDAADIFIVKAHDGGPLRAAGWTTQNNLEIFG